METRRRALSPVRILTQLVAIPGIALAVGVSIVIRTSDHAPIDALRELVALAGCGAAAAVNLAPAGKGRLGYHARNDRDGDGVACNEGLAMAPPPTFHPGTIASMNESGARPAPAPVSAPDNSAPRMTGGAKFLRP